MTSERSYSGQEPALGGERREVPPGDPAARRRAAPHFKQALALIEKGHWEDAADLLRYVLEIVPDTPVAHALLTLVNDVIRVGGEDFERIAALQAYTRQFTRPESPAEWQPAAPEPAPPARQDPPRVESPSIEDYTEPETRVSQWKYAQWLLLEPGRMPGLRAALGMEALNSAGAQLSITLIWLPVTIAALSMCLVELLNGGVLLSLLAPTVAGVIWGVSSYLGRNRSLDEALMLAGAGAFLYSFFTAGMISPLAGVVLFLTVTAAGGLSPALAGIPLKNFTRPFASGVATVTTVTVSAFLFPFIAAITASFLNDITGTAGSVSWFVSAVSMTVTGLVMVAIFMLLFAPVFFLLAGITYQVGFFLSGFLETNVENGGGFGGLFSVGITLLGDLALIAMSTAVLWRSLL